MLPFVPLDTLVPAWVAARYASVTRQTFNYWRTVGKVTQFVDDEGTAAVDERGNPLYRLADVLEAERATRRSPNSRRGVRRSTAA